jgi:DnaJ-class molecular chaperone
MPTTQVKCGRCKGTGKAFPEDPCKGCGGDGFVRVIDPPTQCGRCKGTGKAFPEDMCKGCKGCGWVQD